MCCDCSDGYACRSSTQNPNGLLFEHHRPELWYWEVVQRLNWLLLTGVLVVLAQGSAVQIIVGVAASLYFLKLRDMHRPFVVAHVQTMKEMSLWQLATTFLPALQLC